MSENIKIENNADIGNQTIINIEHMSGNIAASGPQVIYTLAAHTDPSDDENSTKIALSREYYNLFVVCGESFRTGRFILDRSRTWFFGNNPETNEKFSQLDDEALLEIKRLPCIFADENKKYDGQTHPRQKCHLGVVTDIRIQAHAIIVYYKLFMAFRQQKLNELAPYLGIEGRVGVTELNTTHWAIKRVDLLGELQMAGVDVFGALNVNQDAEG